MSYTMNQSRPVDQGDVISIKEALAVLVEQKTFIILFCMSAILTALALTYIASEKYESATTISFRPQEVTRFKAQESQAFGAPSPAPPFELISKNLNELVRSENLLRSVVLELKLHGKIEAPPSDIWYIQRYRAAKSFALDLSNDIWMYMKYGRLIQEDPVFAATKALRNNISFIDKSAYIFYIVVRDKYPQRAPMIVDSIARHLIEYLHDEQQSPGHAKKLQLRKLLDEKSVEIQQTEDELNQLLTRNSIVSSALEAEQSMARWSELELERVQIAGEISNLESRLADSEKLYAYKREQPGSYEQSGNRSGADNVFFIQPEDYKKLSSERLFTQIELSGLRAKYESVFAEIRVLDSVLKKLPDLRIQIEALETSRDILQRDYIQISDTYQDALLASTTLITEAEMLHPATSPNIPVAPVKIYNVGLAAVLSYFIAIALVFLLDYAEIYLLFSPRRIDKKVLKKIQKALPPPPEERRKSRVDRRGTCENPIDFILYERRKGGRRNVVVEVEAGPSGYEDTNPDMDSMLRPSD